LIETLYAKIPQRPPHEGVSISRGQNAMATMPMMDDSEAGADPAMEQAAPDDAAAPEEGDLSQGYTLELSCLPDGTFQLSPPESLKAEADEEQGEGGEPGSEAGETFDSIGAALKAMLKAIKDNPLGGDGQQAFDAGYGAG